MLPFDLAEVELLLISTEHMIAAYAASAESVSRDEQLQRVYLQMQERCLALHRKMLWIRGDLKHAPHWIARYDANNQPIQN